MRILYNEQINIDEYCGKVVFCYFSEDKKAAAPIGEALKASEFRVEIDVLDDDEALTHIAAQEGDRLLDNAGAMVLFLGDSMLSRKNQPKRNLLFHRVGYFCAQSPGNLILCSHAKVGAGILAGTPLQSASVTVYDAAPCGNGGEGKNGVLALLQDPDAGRDFARMKRDIFFKAGNAEAEARIIYRRIGVELAMHTEDFEAARVLYSSRRTEGTVGREEFFAAMEKGLRARMHIFSFGSERDSEGPFTLYRGERSSSIAEYPAHFENRIELIPSTDGDTVATLRVEYVLPVHSYLGLCCKPYIEGERGLDGEVLYTLLRGNFTEEHDAALSDKNRLYYRFAFDSTEKTREEIGSADAAMGRYADIVYPQ